MQFWLTTSSLQGTKIRSPQPLGAMFGFENKQAFEVPLPPAKRLCWDQIFTALHRMRMTSFVCKDSGTTAYSVCCDSLPYTIHAHMLEERDLSFYNAEMRPERQSGVWLYLPINKDERIAEIWVRRWEAEFTYHAALIVSLVVSIPFPLP